MLKPWFWAVICALFFLVSCAQPTPSPSPDADANADELSAHAKTVALSAVEAMCRMDFAELLELTALDAEAQGDAVAFLGLKDANGKIRWRNRAFDDFAEYVAYMDGQNTPFLEDVTVKINRVTVFDGDELDAVRDTALDAECIGYEIAPDIRQRYATAFERLHATKGATVEVVADTLDCGYLVRVHLLRIDGEWSCISPTVVGLLNGEPTRRYFREIKE